MNRAHCVRLGLLVLLIASGPGPRAVSGQQGTAPNTEQQIVKVSNEWFAALMAGDTEALDRLQTDDFLTIQQGRGAVAVVTKAQQLENMRASGERPKFERTLSAVKVRDYGSVAVLTALSTYRTAGPRKDQTISRAVTTEIWVNERGRWRLSHFQPTDVPAAQAR